MKLHKKRFLESGFVVFLGMAMAWSCHAAQAQEKQQVTTASVTSPEPPPSFPPGFLQNKPQIIGPQIQHPPYPTGQPRRKEQKRENNQGSH